MSIIAVNDYDTFADWKTKTNNIAINVGDLALLQTNATSTIVSAINEVKNGNISSINVTGTRYSIDLNGIRYVNITDTGNIDVAGNLNTVGDLTAGGFGSIGGRLDVGGQLTVTGATQINNALTVTSQTSLNTVSITGAVQLNSTLDVTGTITGTVTKCARSITPDASGGLSYLIGGGDLTQDRTFRVDAVTTATANKVVARDSVGDIYMVNSRVAGNLYLTAGTSQIIQNDDGAEASNPSNGEGRIEYSVGRWMLKTGADSARIVDFKRGNSIVSYIATDGVYNGTATAARYADLAEKYTTDKEYPVGTVMAVAVGGDAECTQTWCPSQLAIGVISEKPAFMMNSELEGGQYIALKGRVPVRVVGPITKGQTLVSTPDGCAMFGIMNPIGCALETDMNPGEKLVECAII